MLLFKKVPSKLFSSLFFVVLSTHAAASVIVGKAVSAVGDVLIRSEEGSAGSVTKLRKLKTGQDVYQGDVINTASGASVKLLLVDKSILDLSGSTLFKVDEFNMKNGADRSVAMTMAYGKLRASVNTPVSKSGKYNIRTKTATMGVRGTEFIIASDLAEIAPAQTGMKATARQEVKTRVTVIEGKVLVIDQTAPKKAPISVIKGEQLTTVSEVVGDKAVIKADKAPAPQVVELNQEQLKIAVKEAKIQDRTFRQAVVIDAGKDGGPSSGLSTLTEIGTAFQPGEIGATLDPARPMLFPTPPSLPPGTLPVKLQVVFKK